MRRCAGKKKDDTQCSRKQKNGDKYCWQHIDVVKNEQWKELGFPKPHGRKRGDIEKKIKNGPSKSDGVGYIYIYQLTTDGKAPYYKIGRTARTVDVRLSEWDEETKIVKKFKVKYNKLCESLIHWYLDEFRIHRCKITELDDVYYTVWARSKLPVTKEDKRLMLKYEKRYRKKRIEWFSIVDFEEQLKVIKQICASTRNVKRVLK